MTHTTPPLHLIYARAANGVIGHNNALPWHLPEDLAHFKRQTLGCPVLMGRKTWDSLPPRFRPLPGRLNLVLTRQPGWRAEGAQAVSSLQEALALCPPDRPAWVIGGAEVYTLALPRAQQAVVTEIERDFEGDAHAPTLDACVWREVARNPQVSADGMAFAWVVYERRG